MCGQLKEVATGRSSGAWLSPFRATLDVRRSHHWPMSSAHAHVTANGACHAAERPIPAVPARHRPAPRDRRLASAVASAASMRATAHVAAVPLPLLPRPAPPSLLQPALLSRAAPLSSPLPSSRSRYPRAAGRAAAIPFDFTFLGVGRREAVCPQDSEPRLTSWLRQRGFGEASLSKLVAQQLPGQGRGLVASAPIRQHELALAVPQSLVLLPSRAMVDSALSPLLSAHPELMQHMDADWAPLVLLLAEWRYHLKRQQQQQQQPQQQQQCAEDADEASWVPYMQLLPGSLIGTVLDWSEQEAIAPGNAQDAEAAAAEVSELLAGSGLLPKARSIRAAASALWRDMQPLLEAAREQQLCPRDMFTEHDVRWGVGVCLTRSVRLDDLAGQIALVPFADLLNHEPRCGAYLVWDAALQAVVLRTDRAYAVGEQVFISYGPKSSGELLLAYGFCPPPGSNPHDAAHVTLALMDTPSRHTKLAALRARGIPPSEEFALRIDAWPAGLLPYMAFCAAPMHEEHEVHSLAAQLFDDGDMPSDVEALALDALARFCREALRAYPQDVDVDKRLAAAAAQGGGFEQRAPIAAAIRVRERQILGRTEFVARQRARQLHALG